MMDWAELCGLCLPGLAQAGVNYMYPAPINGSIGAPYKHQYADLGCARWNLSQRLGNLRWAGTVKI